MTDLDSGHVGNVLRDGSEDISTNPTDNQTFEDVVKKTMSVRYLVTIL